MFGQTPIRLGAIGFPQQHIHGGCNAAGGHGQSMAGNFLARVTVAQVQSFLEQSQHAGRNCAARGETFSIKSLQRVIR
jgi:hypothetical protein